MKFYSEKTKQLYSSQEECQEQEAAYEKKLAEKENEKRRLSEERAKRAQEVQKAFDELCNARKNYQDVLSRFCNDYGSYHFSVGSHNSASDAADLILKTIFSLDF